MQGLDCGACGATIRLGDYVALDRTTWCDGCYQRAASEVHEHYAQEEEVGLVDLHAQVLVILEEGRERRSLGWTTGTLWPVLK